MTHPLTDQITALLRAGTPCSQIRAQLGVGQSTITATRKAIGMPPGTPGGRAKTEEQRHADCIRRHPRAVAMIQAGASYRQIKAELGITSPIISNIRRALGIPRREHPHPYRTTAQALALHARPHTDHHTHWTGTHNSHGMPQLWAEGNCHSVLRIAFRLHHDREPQGPVRRGCTDPQCITGAHLTDRTIRAAHHRADHAFERIFGTTT